MPVTHGVTGSSPVRTAQCCLRNPRRGRLAQLVQSVCLTSRGSAVRIRQRPQTEYFSRYRKNFLLIILSVLGRLAQLVQSVCLTSRGSAVRIRQHPPQDKRNLRLSFLFIWCLLSGDVQSFPVTSVLENCFALI